MRYAEGGPLMPPDLPVIFTPEEVAKLVKVPPKTVTAMCAQGRIPGARKFGRRWRIPQTALVAFFAVPEAAPQPRREEPRPLRLLSGEPSDVKRLRANRLAKKGARHAS